MRSLVFVLVGAVFPVAASALEKCIGADGKVTYSDGSCAAGAKRGAIAGAPSGSISEARIEYYNVPAPGGHTAYAKYTLSYRYTTSASPGACRVDTVTTKLDLDVRMPRLAPSAATSPELQSRWARYLSALEVHENGHLQIGRDFESNFKRAALAMSASDCGAIDSAMRAQFDGLLKQANARDKDYDAQTQHGATQGAFFR